MSAFASALIAWQRRHGRRGLPWQASTDPYRVWLSEVMLQQTQVSAVIPYYERFLRKFPGVETLAAAPQDEVLTLWSGLGYYARGRNLHAAAKLIVARGGFPRSAQGLAELPGIGRSSAAAIAAFAFGERAAILDGNVKRVLARAFGVEGWPGERNVQQRLWQLAEELLPRRDIGVYTQALMDLGATVCVRSSPRCEACPVRARCVAIKRALVDRLPTPRPAKALPLRRATWLVLRRAGKVLLERRPGAGLWGGLWTFPELALAREVKDVAGYCERELGCYIRSMTRLEPIAHGFTHFRLRARPLLCEVRKEVPRARAPGLAWLDIVKAREAAVPMPVKALLSRF